MSGRPVIHRAEIGARQDNLDLALANGDDQPVLRVVQDSASQFSRARAEPAAPGQDDLPNATLTAEDCDDQSSLRQSPQKLRSQGHARQLPLPRGQPPLEDNLRRRSGWPPIKRPALTVERT